MFDIYAPKSYIIEKQRKKPDGKEEKDMKKHYRVILINRETGERQMMVERFASRKKAIEMATQFCLKVGNNADFEVKEI